MGRWVQAGCRRGLTSCLSRPRLPGLLHLVTVVLFSLRSPRILLALMCAVSLTCLITAASLHLRPAADVFSLLLAVDVGWLLASRSPPAAAGYR